MKFLAVFVAMLLSTCFLGAESFNFDTDKDLERIQYENASLDSNIRRGESGSSLRIDPKGSIRIPVSKKDRAGTVSFWVYDNRKTNVELKKYHTGALWGIADSKGNNFKIGILYAHYLDGDKFYGVTNYKPTDAGASAFSKTQYIGANRKEGWTKYTFTIDAKQVAQVSFDDVLNKRIDEKQGAIGGITAIILKGDSKGTQTIWLDDIHYELGETLDPLKDPAVTPEIDPEIAVTVDIKEELKGKHPRLLFTENDIPQIQDFIKTPLGAQFFKQTEDYLHACVAPTKEEVLENRKSFLRDATDGQRQGLWRAPTVAIHYALTGDKKSFDKAKAFMDLFLSLDHWELGQEQDLGMSSANVMIGAALLYDILYNDLDEEYRKVYAEKLLLQARRQYYRGHMGLGKSVQYWQGDPANNHRWHRNAGMVLAVLAVHGDIPGTQWILEKSKEDLDYVTKWLPHDGSSHESPSYLTFGATHLLLGLDSADRCLGTNYLGVPFVKEISDFRMHSFTPGLSGTFGYGDSNEKAIGGYNHAYLLSARIKGDADLFDAWVKFMNINPKKRFNFGWFGLVWSWPALEGGSIENLPLSKFFPDNAVNFVRDGWDMNNVGLMHKCGPYGGYDLNKFRNSQDFKYVNIAHDDPDANSIILFADGDFVVKSDAYSYHKKTEDHNTILVNGQGQVASKGKMWTQPPKDLDLTTLSYMTTLKVINNVTITEGEAGNAYEGIDGYRRSVIWRPPHYVLLVDRIHGADESTVSWRMQSQSASIISEGDARYTLSSNESSIDFQVTSTHSFNSAVIESTAEHRKELLGYQQIELTSVEKQHYFITVFNAWKKEAMRCSVIEDQDGNLTIDVIGDDVEDQWSYTPAKDLNTPSKIVGRSEETIFIQVDEKDLAPRQ